jgi:hypothetical protein
MYVTQGMSVFGSFTAKASSSGMSSLIVASSPPGDMDGPRRADWYPPETWKGDEPEAVETDTKGLTPMPMYLTPTFSSAFCRRSVFRYHSLPPSWGIISPRGTIMRSRLYPQG